MEHVAATRQAAGRCAAARAPSETHPAADTNQSSKEPPESLEMAQIAALHTYRRRLEDQLRLLQHKRQEEARSAGEELASLEQARLSDQKEYEEQIAALRADNALLTAATVRMHEQWSRDAVELEALREEMRAMDAEMVATRAESHRLLQSGVGLAEGRYRLAERRHAVDEHLLACELAALEEAGTTQRVEGQLQHLRLLADAHCVGREVEQMEMHAQSSAAAASRREDEERCVREAAASSSAAALATLAATVAEQSAALEQVLDALRTWEACDAAERAHALLSADRLDATSRTLDAALYELSLVAEQPSPEVRLPTSATKRLVRSRSFSGLDYPVPEQSWARSPSVASSALGGMWSPWHPGASGLPLLDTDAPGSLFGASEQDGEGGFLTGVEGDIEDLGPRQDLRAQDLGVPLGTGGGRQPSVEEDGVAAAISASVDRSVRRQAAERDRLDWLSSPRSTQRSTPPGGGRSRPTIAPADSANHLASPVLAKPAGAASVNVNASAATAVAPATSGDEHSATTCAIGVLETPAVAADLSTWRRGGVTRFPCLSGMPSPGMPSTRPAMPSSAARSAAARRERDERRLSDPPLQCMRSASTCIGSLACRPLAICHPPLPPPSNPSKAEHARASSPH